MGVRVLPEWTLNLEVMTWTGVLGYDGWHGMSCFPLLQLAQTSAQRPDLLDAHITSCESGSPECLPVRQLPGHLSVVAWSLADLCRALNARVPCLLACLAALVLVEQGGWQFECYVYTELWSVKGPLATSGWGGVGFE